MNLKTYTPLTVPEAYEHSLSRLHLDGGDMWPTYDWLKRTQPHSATVIIAFDAQHIIGWAIVYKRAKNKYLDRQPNVQRHTWIQLYVRESERRRGAGRKMVKKARSLYPEIEIMFAPWSNTSRMFFDAVDGYLSV